MSYVSILKSLKGYPVYLEHGYPERAAAEVVSSCIVWDLFENDSLVLLVTTRGNQRPPIPVLQPGQSLTKEELLAMEKKKSDYMYFEFKWVRVDRILFVKHDSGAFVDVVARQVAHEEIPPVYNDGKPGWEVMDQGVRYHIENRLYTMGYREFPPPKPGEKSVEHEVAASEVAVPEEPVAMPSTFE